MKTQAVQAAWFGLFMAASCSMVTQHLICSLLTDIRHISNPYQLINPTSIGHIQQASDELFPLPESSANHAEQCDRYNQRRRHLRRLIFNEQSPNAS